MGRKSAHCLRSVRTAFKFLFQVPRASRRGLHNYPRNGRRYYRNRAGIINCFGHGRAGLIARRNSVRKLKKTLALPAVGPCEIFARSFSGLFLVRVAGCGEVGLEGNIFSKDKFSVSLLNVNMKEFRIVRRKPDPGRRFVILRNVVYAKDLFSLPPPVRLDYTLFLGH